MQSLATRVYIQLSKLYTCACYTYDIVLFAGDTFHDCTALFVHQGGEGTREEMCFAFVSYYPRMRSDLAVCGSVPDPAGYVPFIQNDVP